MKLSVTSNINEVLGFTAKLSDQFPFAVARSLTDVARLVANQMPGEMERVFDKGATDFTKRSVYVVPARKDRLTAEVGIKDRQAQYLFYQVEGGTRQPSKQALRLPSVVQLNDFGNVPAGLIRQLINRAKQGKRATKVQARRFGVSQELDLFYGEPGDGRPAGIYKRVVISATKHQLVPIIVFPKQAARYQRTLDFYGIAQRTVAANIDARLASNWRDALASAR